MRWALKLLIGPMRLDIEDLWRLAESGGREHGPERLKEIVDWRVQRAMTIAKGAIGVSVSFVVELLVAQFKKQLHAPSGLVGAAVAFALLIAAFGLYTLRDLARLGTEYTKMLSLLRWLS